MWNIRNGDCIAFLSNIYYRVFICMTDIVSCDAWRLKVILLFQGMCRFVFFSPIVAVWTELNHFYTAAGHWRIMGCGRSVPFILVALFLYWLVRIVVGLWGDNRGKPVVFEEYWSLEFWMDVLMWMAEFRWIWIFTLQPSAQCGHTAACIALHSDFQWLPVSSGSHCRVSCSIQKPPCYGWMFPADQRWCSH